MSCVLALVAAGCHRNNLDSGYGIVWVSLTDSPGDFASYIVHLDSITLTRSDGAVVTAFSPAAPPFVDLTKLGNIEELLAGSTVPIGTYTSAIVNLDYTNANISVIVNGVPQQATIIDTVGAAVTTAAVTVTLDPNYPLVIAPTYATTAAKRLAIDFNLAASTTSVNLATNPVTVAIAPYVTAAIAPPDNKLIRVRGPLINSSVGLGTYTVYIRPFFDEVDSLGSLTLFTDADTIFSTNGIVSSGTPGVSQLSQSSAGSTVTAAYATFQPTATSSASAGIFHAKYVIAGSTLEDLYTQGLEGDVIARSGNTLTIRGSTLVENSLETASYNDADAIVLLGPSTIVTADGTTMTGLNYHSVAVGQHIIARGIYTLSSSSVVTLDSTGASSTNTGSVRLISTQLFGSVITAPGAGTLGVGLQYIDNWPVSNYQFAGNGASAATDPSAANFTVGTDGLTLPALSAGDNVWIDGLFPAFGSAAPDFVAGSVYNESSIQIAGATAAGGLPCGAGNPDCLPASLRVSWSGFGTQSPFLTLTDSGMTLDLTSSSVRSAVIRIGPESIDLRTLGVNPQIVPIAPPAPVTAIASAAGSVTQTLPPTFLPSYSYGVNPFATTALPVSVFSTFSSFASGLPAAIAAAQVLGFEARGTYNRSANTFTAISVAVLL